MKERNKSELEKSSGNNLKFFKNLKIISEMNSKLERLQKQINTTDNTLRENASEKKEKFLSQK